MLISVVEHSILSIVVDKCCIGHFLKHLDHTLDPTHIIIVGKCMLHMLCSVDGYNLGHITKICHMLKQYKIKTLEDEEFNFFGCEHKWSAQKLIELIITIIYSIYCFIL